MAKIDYTIDEWNGCYPSQWKGLIVPQAMSHPAKFSSRLIRRIYDHMLEEGWLRIGDRVLDPFGGVALGSLEAMRHGLQWQGIELEAKFVDLGGQNIDLWNKKFSRMPHWGSGRLVQGDSRFILNVLAEGQQGVVSSPPFNSNSANAVHGETKGFHSYDVDEPRNRMKRDYILADDPENLGNLSMDGFSAAITSPPFRQSEGGTNQNINLGRGDPNLIKRHAAGNGAANAYGTTPGNLANMDEPSGDFAGAISSPPYSAMQVEKNSKSIDLEKQWEVYRQSGGGQSLEAFIKTQELHSQGYGHSDGQLSDLPAGDFEGAVSSPPFENSRSRDFMDAETRTKFARENGISNAEFISPIDMDRLKAPDDIYGDTEGQIGNDSGETFWQAARQIVEQVYLALVPGGHAVWVVKNYVKSKKIVPFCNQWRQLCESVGFVTLHEHHAMLVHDKGTSHTLEGGTVNHKTESKSFFRRLAEKNGSPRIDYEVVFCMVKE